MRNYIKLIFIIFIFFISLCANANEVSFNSNFSPVLEVVDTITVPDQEFVVSHDCNENSIVSSNSNQSQYIFASSGTKKSYSTNYSEEADIKNKVLQQIFSSKYYKSYLRISHKISPHLKNEICTRAP